jgi:hypothetical protein
LKDEGGRMKDEEDEEGGGGTRKPISETTL